MIFEALFAPGTGAKILKPFVIYEDGTSRMALKRWADWVPRTARTTRYRELEAECYESAEHIFSTSEWVRQSLIEDYEIPSSRVTNVGQSHDFNPPSELSTCSGSIIFVGYEFERKGGKMLLEAFGRIRAMHPAATLTLVGVEMNIDIPGVTVLGKIKDKAEMIRLLLAAGIFVLPSIFDPNPHAAMEAMSVGLPVIVSDGCGTQEIIEDGVSGYVIPVGDVQALVDRLSLLLGDARLRVTVGHEGARRLNRSSTWPLVATHIGDLLENVRPGRAKEVTRGPQ
jgi:glycosyltransferase involved in cell wall biosynthesis